MVNIIPVSTNDIKVASRSLSNAFMDDPLQKYVFPDAAERNQRSPAHFEAILNYGVMFGEVYATPGLEGAAVWLPPGETNISPDKAERGGLGEIPSLLGEEAATRFFSVMDFLDPYHKQDVPEQHWYTMVIGVDPAHSGKGFGRALMQHVMQKADQEGTPVYLETAQPSNIRFYTTLGFEVIRELTDPRSGLPLWTFRKMD